MLLSSVPVHPRRYIPPLTCVYGPARAGRYPGRSRLPARLPPNRPAGLPGRTPPGSPAGRVRGGGRRRGPATCLSGGRMTSRQAGRAGLPPGTSSIHARLAPSRQVRPHSPRRPHPARRPRPGQQDTTPRHMHGTSVRPGCPGPRATPAGSGPALQKSGKQPSDSPQRADRYLPATGPTCTWHRPGVYLSRTRQVKTALNSTNAPPVEAGGLVIAVSFGREPAYLYKSGSGAFFWHPPEPKNHRPATG
jgi:hypothetical protein